MVLSQARRSSFLRRARPKSARKRIGRPSHGLYRQGCAFAFMNETDSDAFSVVAVRFQILPPNCTWITSVPSRKAALLF